MIRDRDMLEKVRRMKIRFVEEIKYDRKFYKMSQSKFARMIGIGQPDLSDLERGKVDRFTLDRLAMIAIKLGYDPDLSIMRVS